MKYDVYGNPISCKEKKKTIACIDLNDMDKRTNHMMMMQRHSYRGRMR